jgi:hypothetical protein
LSPQNKQRVTVPREWNTDASSHPETSWTPSQETLVRHPGTRKTLYSKRVPIKQVTYNFAAETVTIALSKPFKGKAQFSFDGVIMAAGRSSNGAFSTFVE